MNLRKWKRVAIPLIVTMLWVNATPLFAYVLPFKGFPKLEIDGNNNLSYNVNKVEGSSSFYNDDNFGHDTTFSQSSNLHVTGELLKDLSVDATFLADRYAPQNLNWHLRYNGKAADVLLGDFNANLTGNDFVQLNRSLSGVQVDTKLPKGSLTALTSTLQAPVQTDTLYGRNVTGPYYLSSTPIVDGSEIVTVNDIKKERGADYTLDYTNGSLNFNGSNIISPADRITVSYEVKENGLGGGQLYAVRGTYPISRKFSVGVTHLQLQGHSREGSEAVKRDQFLGSNSPGPFDLTYRPIIEGSETITFDGNLEPRNIAYTLDYSTGRLLFNNGYIPPYNTTVIIQYRVAVAGTPGADKSVTGVDMNWQALHGLMFNVQAAKSEGNSTVVTAPEQFTGEPIMVTPLEPLDAQVFHLRHTPIKFGSEQVVATTMPSPDNILVRDQDYTLDYITGELRIHNVSIPISSLNPTFMVSYSTEAVSSVLQGDSAYSVGATYNSGKLTAGVRYRRIAPGFSPLEAVGYRNIEHGMDWNGRYAFNNFLSFATTGSDTRLPYNPYSTNTADQIMMDEKNRSYTLNFARPNWPTLSLQHTSQDSSQLNNGVLGNSSITDSFNMNWTRQALNANLNLNHVSTDSRQLRYSADPYQPLPDVPQATDPVSRFNGDTSNASMSLTYQPNERLNVGVNMATNKIKAVQDGANVESGGNNYSLTTMYKPVKSVTLNASLQASDTDASKTVTGSDVPSLKTQNLNLGTTWQPWSKFSLGTTFTRDKSQGGEYSNSVSDTLSVNSRWEPFEKAKFDGYWFTQKLKYIDTVGDSKSNMIGLNAQLGPIGKATVELGAQHLWGNSTVGVSRLFETQGQMMRAVPSRADSVGTEVTGNKLTTLSGKVTYPIAKKHDLYVTGETTHNSGFPSKSAKQSYGIGWNYHLNANFTFTVDAGRVSYKDDANQSLNYKANQMNAQLSWNF